MGSKGISNQGIPFACGRLTYVSTTSINFAPYNGDPFKLSGLVYRIPSGGISAANTSVYVNGTAGQNLAASTLYYVYLFSNSGTLTPDFCTTGHTTDTTTGNVGTEIKSGDNTRSLIGMVYTDGSGLFQQTGSLIGVLSWFNRQTYAALGGSGANYTLTSTGWINIGSSWFIGMLNWASEAVYADFGAYISGSFNYAFIGVAIGGSAGGSASQVGSQRDSYGSDFSVGGGWIQLSEGFHLYWGAGLSGNGSAATYYNNGGTGMTRG